MATRQPIAATPIAFVHAILLAYARYGCDPAQVLKKAQIAPELLTQPGARITAWQMQQISGGAMQELDDEALGWFSRRLPWGSYGMLVRASISAPTLGVAITRWCRHHGLIAPDITITLETTGSTATIRIVELANNAPQGSAVAGAFAQVKEEPATRAGDTEQKYPAPRSPAPEDRVLGGRGVWGSASCPPPATQAPPLPPQNPLAPNLPAPNIPAPSLPESMREFCLVSVLRNVLGVACWLVDSRIALRGVHMPFAVPAHQDAYSVLFAAPTQFGCAQAAIIFDARYLALPLRRDEAALQQMLKNALPLTVLQYRRDRLLVQQVRQALLQHPDTTHSAEGLAHLLHLSPRTLHRQLHEEGASLQGLKDSVRRERATDLLLRTQRPIKQVAQAAGFQNEKSFIRAFKTWSGTTPAEFRRRQAHTDTPVG